MRDVVLALSAFSGIAGRENAVRAYLLEQLKAAPAAKQVTVDRLGNILVELQGKQPAKRRVMFAAHMDEVGGIVTNITADGYLQFACVGGILNEVLFGSRVTVNGHVGVIGGKAVHQCSGDQKKKVPEKSAMLIDIGASSKEEAESVCRVGDAVCFAENATSLGGDRFIAKALDDRAGCAMLLKLALTQPEYDVTLVFTVREEIGCGGAATAAFAIKPDIAVAIDATTASDIMEVPASKQVCQMGGGGVVSFMDRATMYDKALYDEIFRLANEHGITAQSKRMVSGGNDAAALQTAGEGARVAAISLPCRYIHSPLCMLSDGDITETYRLLEVMMNTLPVWDGAL